MRVIVDNSDYTRAAVVEFLASCLFKRKLLRMDDMLDVSDFYIRCCKLSENSLDLLSFAETNMSIPKDFGISVRSEDSGCQNFRMLVNLWEPNQKFIFTVTSDKIEVYVDSCSPLAAKAFRRFIELCV